MRKVKIPGFTIVELLIVIAVLAILAGIVIVAYNGVQEKAKNATRKADISNLQKIIENYRVFNGMYPATTAASPANWHSTDVRTDSNCFNGTKNTDWIPGINGALPQSTPNPGGGVDGTGGCYLYASDGISYVISAWNMINTPQTSTLYRRQGFRDFQTSTSTQFYTCNSNTIGGVSGGSYDITKDYYKHSYTLTNITGCDETPPPGA
jgi:prepilin-type N-terminal cleavage/methylation domain-containing protein